MIISRTPFRISFFGGGTDYPDWYRNNGGAVLSTTFDKYCYITCRELPPFFDHKYRIAYSKVEDAKNIENIEHRAVRAVLEQSDLTQGLEIHCDADLPARSGLGSSSSFVVGILHSIQAFKGKRVSKKWLSHEAIRIEQEILKESVGSQDQTAAAHGGLNTITFFKNGQIEVNPVIISNERRSELNDHLMLFFSGLSRISSNIAKSKIKNLVDKSKELRHLYHMVNEAVDLLSSKEDIRLFGEMLNTAWEYKQSLSHLVSNSQIEEIYCKAIKAGAIGGKVIGAGGGGFMLFFVEPSKQESVRASLSNLIYVPFKFESTGSQIIYYQP
ncbi:GHMP family kinase ATP-binding protein [Endozoicomonas sp. 2B-B]